MMNIKCMRGYNLVPTQAYDKVIPTTEKVVRNVDKVYFDGDKLRVKLASI